MAHVLVVKEAYGDYRRGDVITDPEQVRLLDNDFGHHFVRRPAAHSGEVHEASEPKGKPVKSKTAEKEAE